MTNYQKIKPIHPGEIIREEFMLPLHLTSKKLAQDIKIAPQEIEAVIQEKKDLNMDLICRLSAYFDLPVEFWWNLQKRYELGTSIWQEELTQKQKVIKPYRELYRV